VIPAMVAGAAVCLTLSKMAAAQAGILKAVWTLVAAGVASVGLVTTLSRSPEGSGLFCGLAGIALFPAFASATLCVSMDSVWGVVYGTILPAGLLIGLFVGSGS